MRYGSLCSGIETATVAWESLGWECVFVADIEPFCSAVLSHYYPNVPNLGDINAPAFIEKARACGPIDVLVGGPPCQAFSIAGLRGGLADARGNLTLRYLAVVDALRPRWVVYENVPGILSATSHIAPDQCPPALDLEGDDIEVGYETVVVDEYGADENHAFSCFLAGLSELGYGWSFGVLDAQYFNLAQRRERVFVIGYPGAWQPAAAVLLDPESMSGHYPPSRETRQRTPVDVGAGASGGSEWGGYEVSPALTHSGRGVDRAGDSRGADCVVPVVAGTLAGSGAGMDRAAGMENEKDFLIVDPTQMTSQANYSKPKPGDPCHPLAAHAHPPLAVFQETGHGWWNDDPVAGTLRDQSLGGASHGNLVAASTGDISRCLNAGAMGRIDYETETLITHSLTGEGFDASEDGTGRGTPLITFSSKDSGGDAGDVSPTLRAMDGQVAVSVSLRGREGGATAEMGGEQAGALRAGGGGGDKAHVLTSVVRRLTPTECARLQGFSDNYLDILYRGKPAADGPKYRALGNSMAVPVMRYIGERIDAIEKAKL